MARHAHLIVIPCLSASSARALPADALQMLPIKDLAAHALSYEPERRRLVLTQALAVSTGHGLVTWNAPATVVATRELRTATATYSYVVSEHGVDYGLVDAGELSARSRPAPPPPTPRGLLAALTAVNPGQTAQDRVGAWTVNAGLKKLPGTPAPRAVSLTVDFCPNFQRFERRLFDELASLGKARGKPVPVTAFISGFWLKGSQPRRPAEIKALVEHADSGDVALAFANHSLSHPYLKGTVSLARNFLLKPGVDLKKETLGNELELLGHGLMPAPYFRFPGLISDNALERAVRETFSLVVFGKGSWPGTGEVINFGDVVLVHGNGGEPYGVRKLGDWLRDHRAEIVAGQVDFAGPTAFLPD